MKHRAHGDAIAALAKVQGLRHQRSETVHVAIGAVLNWVGARRIQIATSGRAEGAADARLLNYLAELEAACDRLDAIPSRGRTLAARADAWQDILERVARVQRHLDVEETLRRAAAS